MKVIIDPSEARRFATFLLTRAGELKALNKATTDRLLQLHMKSWKDERYRKFQKDYEEASVLLQRFIEHSEKYAIYLRRKAAAIERYLDGR